MQRGAPVFLEFWPVHCLGLPNPSFRAGRWRAAGPRMALDEKCQSIFCKGLAQASKEIRRSKYGSMCAGVCRYAIVAMHISYINSLYAKQAER